MIHCNYLKLTPKEKRAVDDAFSGVFKLFNATGVPLAGDDRAEHAVEALATAVIASRDVKLRKAL